MEPLHYKQIAQSTAIKQAIETEGHFFRVARRGEWWTGVNALGNRVRIGHVTEVTTVDHNGHSTRVYNRHHFVGTVFGAVRV